MSDAVLFMFGLISASMCAGGIGVLVLAARKDGEFDDKRQAEAASTSSVATFMKESRARKEASLRS